MPWGRGLLLAGALLSAAIPVAAQVDSGPPPSSPSPADSDTGAVADTTPPDTVAHYLPGFLAAVPPGPWPRGTRWRFTRDSLALSAATTLADLLGHIPGVYVARGGWFGAPEIPVYGGQGPLALELYWDGVPYLPLGRDSVWLDPARVPLAPLERIDVQVLPSTLRVYLVSAQQRSTLPRTEVHVATGVNSIAQYRGNFAKRWRSGIGLSLAADYRNIDGIEGTSTTAFNDVDLWLKAEYAPSPHYGASYQILSSSWTRGAEPGLVDRWKQRRLDGMFRAFLAARPDGLGPRVELRAARTHVSNDTLVISGDTVIPDRTLTQAEIELSETRPRAAAALTVRTQGSARPLQVEGRAAWQPLPFLTLSVDGRRSYYRNHAHGNRAHASAGLALPLGFSVRGEVTRVEDFRSPLIEPDTFQWATDYGAYLRWERTPVALEVGQVRRDPFQPLGFAAGIGPVASLGVLPRSTYVTTAVSLHPLPGVYLSGWYFDPTSGGGGFEPPHHGRVSATFFSKFWRVFKSGVFALRGEVAAESWSRSRLGGAGLDSLGTALSLGPATFVETNVELRIDSFTGFWLIRNYNAMRGSYVTGLGYPKRAQYYGVHWYFRN
jgi:hypothetical protein